MAAVFRFYQTNAAAPGVDTEQGTGAGSNDWDFKASDVVGPASTGEEITAGDFSQHVYIKGKFTGSFTSITDVKYYASVLNLSGLGNDAYILASGTDTFVQPTAVSKSGTWDQAPTLSASGVDISTAGLTGGTAGFTDYIGLQLKTNISGAAAGPSSQTQFTLVYSEV